MIIIARKGNITMKRDSQKFKEAGDSDRKPRVSFVKEYKGFQKESDHADSMVGSEWENSNPDQQIQIPEGVSEAQKDVHQLVR